MRPRLALHIYVDDGDSAVTRAIEAGTTVVQAPREMSCGNRSAMLRGRFGHVRVRVLARLATLAVMSKPVRRAGAFARADHQPSSRPSGAGGSQNPTELRPIGDNHIV
jgi:hypothetical protein